MTEKEVLEMLGGMLEETIGNKGFIAGFITKSSAIRMIERRIEEVERLEDGHEDTDYKA